MDGFHMSTKVFGLIFAVLVMGFIGGTQVNVFLLRRFSSQRIFFHALLFQAFTGLVFFTGTRVHLIDLPATLVLFFFLLSIGLTLPNGAALGLAPFSRNAGTASALLGFLQAGAGSLISTGIGVLGASAIAALMAGTGFAPLIRLIPGRTRIVRIPRAPEREHLFGLHLNPTSTPE